MEPAAVTVATSRPTRLARSCCREERELASPIILIFDTCCCGRRNGRVGTNAPTWAVSETFRTTNVTRKALRRCIMLAAALLHAWGCYVERHRYLFVASALRISADGKSSRRSAAMLLAHSTGLTDSTTRLTRLLNHTSKPASRPASRAAQCTRFIWGASLTCWRWKTGRQKAPPAAGRCQSICRKIKIRLHGCGLQYPSA